MLKIYLKDRWQKIFTRQREFGFWRYHTLNCDDRIKSLALDDIFIRASDPDAKYDDRIQIEFDLDFPLGGCFVTDLRQRNGMRTVIDNMPDAIALPNIHCAAVQDEDGHWKLSSCDKEEDENLILITFNTDTNSPNSQVDFFDGSGTKRTAGYPSGPIEELVSLVDDERGLRGVLLRGTQKFANIHWTTPVNRRAASCCSYPEDADLSMAEDEQFRLEKSLDYFSQMQKGETMRFVDRNDYYQSIKKRVEEGLAPLGYSLSDDGICWYLTDPNGFCQRFYFSDCDLEPAEAVIKDLVDAARERVDSYFQTVGKDFLSWEQQLEEDFYRRHNGVAYFQAHRQGLPDNISILRQTKGNFRSHGWVIRPDGTLRSPDVSISDDRDVTQNSGLSQELLPLYGVKHLDLWMQVLVGEVVLQVSLKQPVTTHKEFSIIDAPVEWKVIYWDEGRYNIAQVETIKKLKKYVRNELFRDLYTLEGSSIRHYLDVDLNIGWDLPGLI